MNVAEVKKSVAELPKRVATVTKAVTDGEARYFKENDYLILRNVLGQETLNLLDNYFLSQKKTPRYYMTTDCFGQHTLSRYADAVSEGLLLHLQPIIEKVSGKSLFPTYAYVRIYGPLSTLTKHTDRPSCEISASLTVAYKASKIWPIFVESHGKAVQVELDRGDMLIYKGCELPHWREQFDGNYLVQVFLHFVDANGQHAEWKYDKRKSIDNFCASSRVKQPRIIEDIELLGKTVDALWTKVGRRRDAFSKIALDVLRASQVHKQFTMEEFLRVLFERKTLPKQLARSGGFGQPPFTLYWKSDFVVDVYFWVTPIVNVHSHDFQGAFTVLKGHTLHWRYTFQIEENLNDQVLFGNLLLQEACLLKPGDTQEIQAGPKFIHQVTHVSCPTVSLVIRTIGGEKKEGESQYRYVKPHLAIYERSSTITKVQSKQLETLLMLHRVHSPLEEVYLDQLISQADPDQACRLLYSHFKRVHDISLIERVVERIPQLRKWGPYLLASLGSRRLSDEAHHWTHIQHEGERVFLAMLHNCTERDQIEQLVQAYCPGKSTEESVLGWLKGLMGKKRLGFELNETALEVFTLLFRGCDEDEICQQLSGMYDVQDFKTFRQDIYNTCGQLRSHEFLSVLIPKGTRAHSLALSDLPTAPVVSTSV